VFIKRWHQQKIRYSLLLVVLGFGLCLTPALKAENFPDKPISIIIGFPPGTSADSVARIIGEKMGKDLGQPIIVKNKPGVGGSLALADVAKSKPDGYTLALTSTGPMGINPHLYKEIAYDALLDFAPVGQTTWLPYLLVSNKTKGLDSVAKVIQYARIHPDQMNYSSIGLGTTSHLLMAMFLQKAGIQMVHIPYTGSSQSQSDVIAGNVDMTFDTLVSTLPHVQSGRLNGLAVSTATRAKLAPNIPTLQEQGIADYNMGAWLGIVAPKGTPPVVINKLHAEFNKALRDSVVRQKLEDLGTEVVMSESPQAFAKLISDNYQVWGDLIKQAGIERK